MADVHDRQTRSKNMAAIKGQHTKPELTIRKALYTAGFRYRLHDRKLPGKPDIVLHRYKAAIFINGCFWHQHHCHLFKWPATRVDFWKQKISKNVQNDLIKSQQLRDAGWRVAIIWECALKGRTRLSEVEVARQLIAWLTSSESQLMLQGADVS